MIGILAGDTLQSMNGRDYSSQGTLGCVGCGAVLTSGPGFSFKDGSLGGQMQTGPGYSYRGGALGRRAVSGGLGLIKLTGDLLIGGAIGMVATWLVLRKK